MPLHPLTLRCSGMKSPLRLSGVCANGSFGWKADISLVLNDAATPCPLLNAAQAPCRR